MKYIFKAFSLFILLLSPISLSQNNTRENIISEIENIVKPQYGEDYIVDIDFVDSLIGNYSEGRYFIFEDPDHLLNGSVLFSAVKYYDSRDNSIFGIYKDGNIVWHTDPIIRGVWENVFLIKDINNDSKIDIVTKWYIPDYVECIWIFSWDGISGSILNDFDNSITSDDRGLSKLLCDFNTFQIFDFNNDGILEMRCAQGTTEETFSWNGNLYGVWADTPEIPPNYIFPANRLTVTCKATVAYTGNVFEYSYQWSNDSNSQQSVKEITLYNSSCDGEVESPWNWLGNSGGFTTPLIGWTAVINYGQMIPAGHQKDSFNVVCYNYPKIVDYYVQGNCITTDITAYEDIISNLLNNSFHGYTIGPADTMDNFVATEFLDTLLGYTNRSFELHWIVDSVTTSKYTYFFNIAKTQLQQSEISSVRATLQSVLQEVDIDSTNNLTSEAYALIKYNTEYLLDKIPSTPANPNLLVNLKNSLGNQIPASNVQYYEGSWKDAVNNGDGTFTVITNLNSVSLRMTYEYALQTVSNISAHNNTHTFQTINAIVQLKNSLGNLIDVGTVQYYAGAWRSFGTTTNGVAAKELLPINYSFRMTYEYASIDKQQNLSVDPTVVFQTVNAQVQLKNSSGNLIDQGTVQYYAGAWRTFGTTSNGVANKELLPLNYSFRMTYEYASIDKQQNLSVDPTVVFQTVNAQVQLKNSLGNLQDVGTVQYYAGAWRTFGTTTNGVATKELLPINYSFRMTYQFASIDKQQNLATDPTVIFQTVNAQVQLKNSLGNFQDVGTVQYYAGAWRSFGTTTNGVAAKELLPINYSFRMTHAFLSKDKQQNISTNPVVDFTTVLCTVKVSNAANQPINNANVKYYAGAWRDLGVTNASGITTKELLPQNISFRASYGSTSADKQQDITTNNLVEIQAP